MSHSAKCSFPHAVATTGGVTGFAGATGAFFAAAAAFLATALPFVFVAFRAADFNFLPRIAFFCIELRFLAMFLSSSRA
jgi:hypothetical protein